MFVLIGLPASHFSYVKNMVCLHSYSTIVTGSSLEFFEVSSKGKMYIDPYAWIDDNSDLDRTQYPAHVLLAISSYHILFHMVHHTNHQVKIHQKDP